MLSIALIPTTQGRQPRTARRHILSLTSNSQPIINHHPSPHKTTPSIHTPRDQRHLQQTAQLILILHARLRMHHAPRITQRHIRPHQHIIRHRLSENLHPQHIRHQLLRLPLNIRMHQRHVIIRYNHISQCGQPLLNTLDLDGIGERVAQVLEFLIRGRCGHEQAVAVSGGQTTDYAGSGDGAVADWNQVGEFGFED